MYPFTTIRRRLLIGAGLVLVLSSASLVAVHTRLFKRFVLVQVQVLVKKSQRLQVDADELDYDLLHSRYELRNVVLRGAGSADLPAPVRAKRVVLVLPVWRLVRGAFETAQIHIEGLSIRWIVERDGRTNWPSFPTTTGSDTSVGGPLVLATNAEFVLQDDRDRLLLELQRGTIRGEWQPARAGYGLSLETGGGRLLWKNAPLALDHLELHSLFGGNGFVLDSLRLSAGASLLEGRGRISGTPAQIDASADCNIDIPQIRQIIGLALPAQGRLQAQLKAAGPLTGFRLDADLRGADLLINKIPLSRPALAASLDTGTGELQIQRLTSGVLSGQLSARGRIWTAGSQRSQLEASLTGLEARRVAAILGVTDVPARRVAIELAAFCPGLDWRRANMHGTVRAQSLQVSFQAAADPAKIRTSLFSSLGNAAGLRGDLALNLADRALTGEVSGEARSLAQLGAALEDLLNRPRGSLTSLGLDGTAHWTASLGGTVESPTTALQLDVGGLTLGKVAGAEFRLTGDYSVHRISLQQARLTWGDQAVEFSGEVGGASGDAPLRLDGIVRSRSLAALCNSFGVDIPIEGEASGDVRVRGTAAQPAAEALLHAPALRVFGEPLTQVSLGARWLGGTLTLDRLTAQQNPSSAEPGSLEAAGSFEPGTGAYAFKLAAKHLTPTNLVLPNAQAVKGTLDLTVDGKGSLSDPVFSATLSGRDVQIGDIVVGDLSSTLEAANHKAVLNLSAPALHAEVGSTVAMEGNWPYDLQVKAQDARWGTSLAAAFDADAKATGTLAPADLQHAAATISNFRLSASGLDVTGDGPIELSYADGRVQVGRLELKSGDSVLRVSGALPLQDEHLAGALVLRGTLDLEPLGRWLPEQSKVGGRADIDATVSGTFHNSKPSGTVEVHDGVLQVKSFPLQLEKITGRLNLADGVVRADEVSAVAGQGSVKMEGSVPLHLFSAALPAPARDPSQPARLSAQADGLQLTLGKGEHLATARLGFKLQAQASSLSLDGLQAEAEFHELELKGKDADSKQVSPTRLSLAAGTARLERFEVKGPGSELSASGSLGLTGSYPLQLESKGTVDLAAVASLEDAVEAAGTMRVDVKMGGTLDEPRINGSVALANARVALVNPQVQASNLTFEAVLEGDRVNLQKLSGTLNGGTFTGSGTLELGTKGVRNANVVLNAKDVFLEYPTSMKTTSSLDLKLVSRKGQLAVEGKVDVQEGYYESPLDVFSTSDQLPQAAPAVEENSVSTPVVLDVRVVTKRPVEMDNNFGRLSATADLRLAGTIDKPRLLGSLQLEQDGKLYFGDRTYYIERGTVKFLDALRLTPEFNILAYTRAADYTIKLGLTGELGELTTTFTSDPPLSRDDVIAVLLTGKTLAENKGVDLRSLEAFSLATGAMNASLSSKMHRTLGVSRVSVQPAAVAAESNPGARITITQDFTDSMRLLYSMNLSDSNDQIWVGEYDISRRFTTRAVKQSDNTYRGEFRHDVRFGTGTGTIGKLAATPVQTISKVTFTGGAPFTTEELAKKFKLKPGQKYRAQKVRKNSDRLTKYLAKKGYLESRVRLDREDQGNDISLTVRIELGPVVELAYAGANIPGKQRSRMLKVWQAGISDQQRPQAVKDALLGYFAKKGYLQAKADSRIASEGGRKRVQFDLEPGTEFHGVKTALEGAAPEREKEILEMMGERHLEPSVNRDPRRTMEAITRFYQVRGYLGVKVATPIHKLDAERRTGSIVIPIEEGPLFHIGNVSFTGNRALTPEMLSPGLPVVSGAVFEPGRMEPSLGALKLKYGKLGFREAHVEYDLKRNEENATVDVAFAIAENKQTSIGTVTVEGTRQTDPKFVRDRLLVGEGQLADTTKVRESMRSLSQTGAYAATDIQFKLPQDAGANDKPIQVADVVVSVSEPKPFRLLYGGLYDSGSGPGFIADFQNHNSLGAGRILGLRARADSDTDELRLYVSRPFWGSKRISTTLSSYFTRETVEGQTATTDKLGLSLQQDWVLRSKFLLSYGYRYEKQRGFVPDPAAPPIPEEVVSVAPITLTISRDSRDNFLDATRGSFISHGFEYAPKLLGSDYPYFRYYLQYFKYFSLTKPRPVPYGEQPKRSRLVFATGSRLGLQKGFNSEGAVLTDRFYAGGGTTVRGFKQDELGPKLENGEAAGGNAVLVLNEELRFPLFWIFDAVGFVDVGNVFPRVTDFKLSELRKTGGFGLRIRNPFVVLRFDYGFKFDRRPGESAGAFFFSIGQAF